MVSGAKGRLSAADDRLLTDLRNGGESAFTDLVARHHTQLVRAARKYVRDPATAADVAQETWVGFLEGIHRFEGRCSIKGWLYRILFNKAQTRVRKECRQVPFSTLATNEVERGWNSVDPVRFQSEADGADPGHWVSQPASWKTDPEQILERKRASEAVSLAIEDLPAAQGTVMILRDLNGLSSQETCEALGISAGNQRVLLHRARTAVRRALSAHYGDGV